MTRVRLSTRSSVRDSMDKKQVRRRNNGYINANKLTRRVWNFFVIVFLLFFFLRIRIIISRLHHEIVINYPFQIALLEKSIFSTGIFPSYLKQGDAIQCLHYRGEPLPWLKKLAVRIATLDLTRTKTPRDLRVTANLTILFHYRD